MVKKINFDLEEVREAAQRVYDIDIYEAMNAGETPETLQRAITENPVGIINFLLDYIEGNI